MGDANVTTMNGLKILQEEAARKRRRTRPVSDLLYVERVTSYVVETLSEMADNTEDVEVAARYMAVAREFPFAFLRWAAGEHRLDEALITQSVQRRCEEIPLFVNLNNNAEVKETGVDRQILPVVCIEALVYVNAGPATDETSWLRRHRTIKEMMSRFTEDFRLMEQQERDKKTAQEWARHQQAAQQAQNNIKWQTRTANALGGAMQGVGQIEAAAAAARGLHNRRTLIPPEPEKSKTLKQYTDSITRGQKDVGRNFSGVLKSIFGGRS